MERKDYKRSGSYEANGHGGFVTTDESRTELSGTRAEADLIVKALAVYIALERVNITMGVEVRRDHGSAYHPKQTADAATLLGSISKANFVEEETPAT